MRKSYIRTFVACISLALVFLLFPSNKSSAETVASGTCGDNLTWSFEDGTLTISGSGEMSNWTTTTVPWSGLRAKIRSVVFTGNINSIGAYAFYDCSNLTSITIPNTVTSIGSSAFDSCTSLESFTIPDSVTSIAGLIMGCTGLKDVYYSGTMGWDRILNIVNSNNATFHFNSVENLTLSYKKDGTLTIPDSGEMSNWTSTTVPWKDLRTKIKSVVFTGDITSIGDYAFYDCSNLTSITIPNSVTSIGNHAFENCTSLTSITIPDSVTSIGDYVFYKCTSLTSITIPNSVTSICFAAFSVCKSLTSITIPNSVTSIGDYAFYACSNLTSITIPNSVTSIGNHAFENCTSLTSITIPDSVTSIGDFVFYKCESLTSITYPNSVTSIGWCALKNCSSLTSITIPNSVTSIGEGAFEGCESLESITIPGSVTSIGGAFVGCKSLKDVYYSGTKTDWDNITKKVLINATIHSKDAVFMMSKYYLLWVFEYETEILTVLQSDVMSNLTSTTVPWEDYKANIRSVVIDYNITSIGNYAFSGCSDLTSITFSSVVKTIGDSAFEGCESLKDVYYSGTIDTWNKITKGTNNDALNNATIHYKFGENLTWSYYGGTLTISGSGEMNNFIETTPWEDYKANIRSVVISGDITSIGNYAFSGCSGLTSITIPKVLTRIGYAAFGGCSKLKDVYYGGSETDWNKISVGSGNTLLVNANIHYAIFEITVSDTVNGTATVSKNLASVGDEITVTATPDDGYVLDCIKVNDVAIEGNKFTMGEEKAIVTVTFKKIEYTITVSETSNGSVIVSKDKANVGDKITITATPETGYELDTIKVNNMVIDGLTFIMGAGDTVVDVSFRKIQYSITVGKTINGTATVDIEKASVGDEVTVTATPDEGYEINTITVNGTEITGLTFTMGAGDTTVIVTFKKIEYSVTLSAVSNGEASVDKEKACIGDKLTVTVNPAEGYELDEIKVNGNPIIGKTFDMPAENVTVTVAFKKIEYSVTVGKTTNGTATSDKDKACVGDTVKITVTPDPCYELDVIKVNGETQTDTSFTMPAGNATVVVTFKAKAHQLTPVIEKPATCEEDGYEAHYKCTECHKLFSDADGKIEISAPKVITKLGHSWDEGTVTKEPTCEEAGVKTFHCTRTGCSETKTEPIKALGHKIVEVAEKAPTKTEPGNIKHYKCERCGKLFSDSNGKNEITKAQTVIPAMGHDLTAVKAKAATCTEPGNTAYYICKDDDCNCGKAYSDPYGQHEINIEDTVIPVLGHNPKEVAGKDPTCTEDGYEKYYKCSRCNKLFSDAEGKNEIEKPVVIPKLGHDMKHIEAKKPTHEDDGHKEYYHCDRCGKNFADEDGKTALTDVEIVVPHIGAAVLGEEIADGDFKYKITNPRTDGTGTVTIIGVENETESVVIPDTVELKLDTYKVNRIGTKAFYGNKTIKTVSMGSNVTVIDNYAFYGCTNLVKVSGGARVQTIGSYAFAYCSKLSSFTISSSTLKKISPYTFNKDKKLKTIYIKNTTKLTKGGVKKSLKGSSVKTVKVKKSKVKKFKKYFTKKNCGRKVKVKK